MFIQIDGVQGPALEQAVAGQLSTDTETVLAGSALDAGFFKKIGFTFSAVTNDVDVYVYRANKPDYSDEVLDGTKIIVSAGGNKSYENDSAFRYYRLKIQSEVPGQHGTCTAQMFAK